MLNKNHLLVHLLSILLLPFVVLVVIPLSIQKYIDKQCCIFLDYVPDSLLYLIAVPLLIVGFLLFARTIYLFATKGKGTLAPWAPPDHLVIDGPYAHVRNPMISSVNIILLCTGLILKNENILMWQLIFFAVNSIYFVLQEEPGLKERFGAEYQEYKENVGRWIPRISAWKKDFK